MFNDLYEELRDKWQEDLHNSLIKGKVGVRGFLQNNRYSDGQSLSNLGFKLIHMTEEGVRKILAKEIDCINDESDPNIPKMLESLSYIGGSAHDSGILVQSLPNTDKFGRETTYHYIYAIFINNLKI